VIRDLLTVSALVLVAIVLYRFRQEIAGVFRRFDERNVRRIAEQEREKTDPLAHYRHTLGVAEEQVEEIAEITVADERLGTPVTRFLFEGEQFASLRDAERARTDKVRAIARGYYMDLPVALAERRKDKLN
jgi:hypothetical protein